MPCTDFFRLPNFDAPRSSAACTSRAIDLGPEQGAGAHEQTLLTRQFLVPTNEGRAFARAQERVEDFYGRFRKARAHSSLLGAPWIPLSTTTQVHAAHVAGCLLIWISS